MTDEIVSSHSSSTNVLGGVLLHGAAFGGNISLSDLLQIILLFAAGSLSDIVFSHPSSVSHTDTFAHIPPLRAFHIRTLDSPGNLSCSSDTESIPLLEQNETEGL